MTRMPVRHPVVLSALVLIASGALIHCTPDNTKTKPKEPSSNNKPTQPPAPKPDDVRQSDMPTFTAVRGVNVGELSIPGAKNPTPLAVETMKVDVMIVGRMARTEVTQVFRNHTRRRTEGTYTFTLPEGAALSRLAMTVGEKLVEGELVEREKARMIYESIVRKQKDPALLEWQGGNRFSTQVFPIEPQKTKTIVIAYEVLLPEQHGKLKYNYDLPKLDGLAKKSTLGDFSFTLKSEDGLNIKSTGYSTKIKQLSPGGEVQYTAKAFKPGGPLSVSFDLDRSTQGIKQSYATKDDKRYFLSDVVPNLPQLDKGASQNIVVALDTSAGLGQPVLDRASSIARALLEQAPEGTKLQVVTGDYKIKTCGNAPISLADAQTCLQGLKAGGATNLEQLLLTAASEAKTLGQNTSVVVFTDGVASIGEMDGALIQSRTTKAMPANTALHTIAIGHSANEDGLRKLSRASKGQSVRVTPSEDPATALARISSIITEPLLADVVAKVTKGKVSAITPNAPQNIARGEALAVMGTLDEGKDATIELTGTYRGKPWRQSIQLKASGGANNPLLTKFWARRQIDVLQKQDAPRADIVKLSKSMGVLSPYTSFLVLESDEAFKKYQIKRKQEEEAKRKKEAQIKLALNDKKSKDNVEPADAEKETEEEAPEEDEAKEAPKPDAKPVAAKNLQKAKGNLQDLLNKPRPSKSQGQAEPQPEIVQQARSRRVKKRRRIRRRSKPGIVIERGTERPRSKPKPSIAAADRLSIGRGSSGMGMRGVGKGGGGDGFGRIGGLGKVNTGSSNGYGVLGSKSRPKRIQPIVIQGKPQVTGSMDKEIVRRVMRHRRNAMRYCYERELRKNPSLAGNIIVKFIINGQGKVETAFTLTSTLNNKNVERCITKTIKRMRFPKPTGFLVNVSYPIQFKTNQPINTTKQNAERLKALEARKKDLKRAERTELLEQYALNKKNAQAKAWFKTLVARIPKDKMPQGQLELLRIPETQTLFFDAFADAVAARIKQPDIPSTTLTQFAIAAARTKDSKALVRALGDAKLKQQHAITVLSSLLFEKDDKNTVVLFEAWKKHYSATQQLNIIESVPSSNLNKKYRVSLLKDAAMAKDATNTNINRFINYGFSIKQPATTTAAALQGCEQGKLSTAECGVLLTRYSAAKVNNDDVNNLRKKMSELFAKELKTLHTKRAEDMANRQMIIQAAALLEKMGDADAAERMLSEMVEFAPHDYMQRLIFGHQLVNRKQITEACNQYATAVQLNPAKRDTFRTMMRLRRAHPDKAKEIRNCIVNGVSRLPVKRAVSIILTWDTPRNDVDLHIREAGNAHVSFRNKESKNGGLLYYDITDGYGPEIYVLGSGPVGTYPISLVYYGGSQRNVKATITILRDAGSPEESRKDISFVLPKSNSSKEYRVGQFILTERDKSGDTSTYKKP